MAERTGTRVRTARTRAQAHDGTGTSETVTGGAAQVRRRPKDRKVQIATVAAEAFSDRGYHAVSIDEIAAAVGISGPALYRHFPNKYALFQDAAMRLVTTLDSALHDEEASRIADPAGRLDAQILAAVRTTVANRRTAGLYRWESRYLDAPDRARIRATIQTINRTIGSTLAELRPDLSDRDSVEVSVAILSVTGSITAHRAALSARRLENLLLDACRTVSRVDLPAASDAAPEPPAAGIPLSNKREVLLNEAIPLFDARGYHDVSIEDIGSAAGINASGVYRHFTSKADLLAAAFHRAADRLTVAVGTALGSSTTPLGALRALVEVYVNLSFAQSELMGVYFAEIGNLPGPQRTELRNLQRLNVEEWAHLLGDVRTELSAVECRFLVHAALNLVLDVGRLMHFQATPHNERRVQALMLAVLLGERA